MKHKCRQRCRPKTESACHVCTKNDMNDSFLPKVLTAMGLFIFVCFCFCFVQLTQVGGFLLQGGDRAVLVCQQQLLQMCHLVSQQRHLVLVKSNKQFSKPLRKHGLCSEQYASHSSQLISPSNIFYSGFSGFESGLILIIIIPTADMKSKMTSNQE